MWPSLPESGFIIGRPAVEDDVSAGNAVFVLRSDGVLVGRPLQLEVPQYVYHLCEDGGPYPAILIQAEGVEGMEEELLGVRYLDGKTGVGLLTEFELLGTECPTKPS